MSDAYGVSVAEVEAEQERLFWERVYVAALHSLAGAVTAIHHRAAASYAENVAELALRERSARFKLAQRPEPAQPPPAPKEDEPRYLGEPDLPKS